MEQYHTGTCDKALLSCICPRAPSLSSPQGNSQLEHHVGEEKPLFETSDPFISPLVLI